jgi:hypothetical protein
MKTLWYVPMIHRDEECSGPNGQAHTEEQAELRETLQDNYWELVFNLVMTRARKLDVEGQWPLDLDVFCEAVLASRQFDSLNHVDTDIKSLSPDLTTLLALLYQMGARTHVTEGRWTYGIHRLADRLRLSRISFVQDTTIRWRDRHIAAALASNVADGGTALLFMGAGHDVPAYLDSSWEVVIITAAEIPVLTKDIMGRSYKWMRLYHDQPDRHRISEGEMEAGEI